MLRRFYTDAVLAHPRWVLLAVVALVGFLAG